MQFLENEYIHHTENEILDLAVISVIGDREDQQDNAGAVLGERDGLVVVCDGMGGQAGGRTASTTACRIFLSDYENEPADADIHAFLLDAASEADNCIAELKNSTGDPVRAGSTVTAVCIRDNALFWLSVGDSRIYIYRKGELVRATADHNYKYLLDVRLESGQIDEAEYREKIGQGEALVSFLGIGGLPFIEANDIPFRIEAGDRILLTSDGLYKLVSDEGIKGILRDHENTEEALNALEQKARKSAENTQRDNMTAALIRIK